MRNEEYTPLYSPRDFQTIRFQTTEANNKNSMTLISLDIYFFLV